MKKNDAQVKRMAINTENEEAILDEKSGEEIYKERADEKGKVSSSRKVDLKKHSAENAERIAHKNQPKESAWKRSCRLKKEAVLKDTSKHNPKNVRTKVSDEE